MKRVAIRCTTAAVVTERWVIDVPDELEVNDDNALDILRDFDGHDALFVSVENESVDDEHDRDLLDIEWFEVKR